jgi:Mg2+ and Co2+ transporter CorA
MTQIDRMSDIFAGILDQIDDEIEHAEALGGQMHFMEVRAEQLRDEMSATFSRLRKAGNDDRAWERAYLRAETLYQELVSLRKNIDAEVEVLADAAGVEHPQPVFTFLN